ncbi:MAG: hypothetical protein IPF92_18645 [Myxococcales bacterium]|jgi:hypothetical protein|nr:hypothetical protein [Myxococcales bacterium]MBL0197219.1 hypothetical protein [Myxococcales bacterium]HQY60991.1 hypothetical protein [Polyangiaceae bacterium]
MSALALAPVLVDPSIVDLEAAGHMSAGPSFLLGVLLLLFAVGAALAALFAHARALVIRGRREADAITRPGPLFAGPSKVVRGRVAFAEGSTEAVRVLVKQRVKNHTSKNSKWHTWEETERVVHAQPFYLTRQADTEPGADGEAVLVEPSHDVFVVDALETRAARESVTRRERVCEVSEGEVFSAYGTLVRGPHPRARTAYRDGAQGWILKPPRTGKMVLASGTIDERYTGRVSFVRGWTAVLTVVWAVFNVFVTVPFLAASTFGEHEIAEVTGDRTWTTRNKSSTTHHYAVQVLTESGYRFEREIASRGYYAIQQQRVTSGVRVPVVHALGWERAAYLGDRPTMNAAAIIFGLIAAGVSAGLFRAGYRKAYAWYDKDHLSEEGGKGHLP